MPVHSVEISYDQEGDVLYLALDHRDAARTIYFADDAFETVNWERPETSGEIVGALVWAYSTWNRASLQQLLEARLGRLPTLPSA